MPATRSILMVKNSRSFELTKIRHYKDKPYRILLMAAGSALALPALNGWREEPLGGGFDALLPLTKAERAESTERSVQARKPVKSSGRKVYAKLVASVPIESEPLIVPAKPSARKAGSARTERSSAKRLSLGETPARPIGENCNLDDLLVAAEAAQKEGFAHMIGAAHRTKSTSTDLPNATAILEILENSFGEELK
jgi:type IV secretion system protein VirD4